MRLALSVSATFFRNYLFNQGRFFIHGYLLTYLLVAAKVAPTELLKILWVLFPFAFALGFVPSTFGRNMGWLTALSISRTTFVLTAIGSAFAMTVVALLLAWPSTLILGGNELFWGAAAKIGSIAKEILGIASGLRWSNGGLNVLLYGVLFVLIAGLIAFPRDMRKIAEMKLGRRAQRPTLKSVAPSLVAVTAFLLLVGKFASQYLFFMIVFGGVMFGIFGSLDQTYGLPPGRRRFYLRGTIVLLVVVVLGSFLALRAQLGSEDRALALSAQEMLPAGFSGISEERLARFAASVPDAEALRKVLKVWRSEWYPDGRVPFAPVKELFKRAEFLSPLFANVRNEEIPSEYFMAIVRATPVAREGAKGERGMVSVLKDGYARDLSDAQIDELLASEHAEVRAFARGWLGYRFERANAERIVASLRKPPSGLDGMNLVRERVEALEIVSEMAAKELRFEDVFGPRSAAVVRALAIPPPDVDCGSCGPKSSTSTCSGVVQAYCARVDHAKSYGIKVR